MAQLEDQRFNARVSVPNFHGFTVLTVMGHASARYFQPQVGGLGTSDGPVFRIDHDQNFQQTTHVQYQPWNVGRGWPLIGATTVDLWLAPCPSLRILRRRWISPV